ncbi:MAG: glycosyltransferase family 2 protein [Planctomycetota bacterium]|jgi:glycosyltransferase involved in cell wall biosynthesis
MAEPSTSLSACILAFNEEDRIEACIASLKGCDEILVVDSHSEDKTRELARAMGARVVERDWPGFLGQRTFAVAEASHDWILIIDADERLSPELQGEIGELKAAGFPDHAGWQMPRCSEYMGRWIRHGTWYPNLVLRLFDRRRGKCAGKDPHDRVEVEGPVGKLQGDLLHHPYRNFKEHMQTIDRYTTTMAEEMLSRGKRAHFWNLAINPAMRFFRFYVLRMGFLCGWRGLLLAFLAAHYVRLKYAKAMRMQRAAREAPST